MTTTEVSCEYKDFIGTYRNVYPDDFCEHMINAFEHIRTTGLIVSLKIDNKKKKVA